MLDRLADLFHRGLHLLTGYAPITPIDVLPPKEVPVVIAEPKKTATINVKVVPTILTKEAVRNNIVAVLWADTELNEAGCSRVADAILQELHIVTVEAKQETTYNINVTNADEAIAIRQSQAPVVGYL